MAEALCPRPRSLLGVAAHHCFDARDGGVGEGPGSPGSDLVAPARGGKGRDEGPWSSFLAPFPGLGCCLFRPKTTPDPGFGFRKEPAEVMV